MLTARARRILGSTALAAMATACGGDGGDGGGAFLPLRETDELVNLLSSGTTSNDLKLCQDGARIYVAWAERGGVVDAVFFNRSLDGGVTWLAEPVQLDDDRQSASQPEICCDGDRVYVAFRTVDDDGARVRLNRSLDAGTTFLTDSVPVSTPGRYASFNPTIDCDGATVHVAWVDTRDGLRDVRYNRSTNAGVTFPNPDVSIGTAPGVIHSEGVSLCCDGPNVYAAWLAIIDVDTIEIRSNRSIDAGVTFLAGDVPVSHATTSVLNAGFPVVACEGTTVAVAWWDLRNGPPDVFLNRSTDAGLTFLDEDRRLNTDGSGTLDPLDPALSMQGDRLHVVWEEIRPEASEVRYNRSADGGLTFLDEDRRIGNTGVADRVSGLRVFSDESALAVAWNEDRPAGSLPKAFLAVSTNDGDDFTETRVDRAPPGTHSSFSPSVALLGDRLTVVWLDVRDNAVQIRSNRTAP